MIIKMKKVTLLSIASDRDATLSHLRELGILHLQHVTPPEGGDLDAMRADLKTSERVLNTLRAYAPDEEPHAPAEVLSPAEIVAQTGALLEEKRERAAELTRLTAQHDAQEPFGDFDPASVQALADKGIRVRLYSTSNTDPIPPPDTGHIFVLSTAPHGTCFALVGDAEPTVSAREYELPSQRLSEIAGEISQATARLAGIEGELGDLSRQSYVLVARMAELRKQLGYQEAERGMGRAGVVEYLQGYCPHDRADALSDAAAHHGWGLVISDPDADDKVPTLIRSPAWIRPIKSLFGLLDIVPGYDEVDTRFAFLVFFSLFFGVLVNDAGYGLLFLILTIALRLKMKNAPAEPFRLVGLLSVCAIVWGVLTGSYFGIAHIPAPMKHFEIGWLKHERNIIAFSFFVGAVHLTVAHIWKATHIINSTRALAQVGWILIVWSMYFASRFLILGQQLPAVFPFLLITGIALLIVFMTPLKHLKKEWTHHIMLPFDVIASFADLVSYVRLFAVGTASMAVAEAFNELALQRGMHTLPTALVAVVILLLGHGLNVVLCVMSILVHGVRLNTLEFSNHVGLEWSGFRYSPFSRFAPGEVDWEKK